MSYLQQFPQLSKKGKPRRCEWVRIAEHGRVQCSCRHGEGAQPCPCCSRFYCKNHQAVHERMMSMNLFKDLRGLGVWRGYDQYVVKLEPVLREMSARGMPVSPARYEEVKAELEKLHESAKEGMQQLVPKELWPFSPKLGYKKLPKDFNESDPQFTKRWFWQDPGGKWITIKDKTCLQTEERWVRLEEWAPSHKSLTEYALSKKHELPRDWKSLKVTFADDELDRLARTTKDWLYPAVQNYRRIGMFVNNFLPNWKPTPEGRVHPTFYYDTGTGQLASRRPNVQNAPKHGDELASKFRSCVEAPEGYTLLEADYKSFHVHTLAFEAQDPVLMRLAGLDIHSFVTAHFLRLPGHDQCYGWDDEKLAAYLAQIKKEHKEVRDAKVKHAFLGYDNGMGYRKLYFQYREFFSNQTEAKQVMAMFDVLFPRAKTFRERICRQAHEQGYLISRFGCVRWFWEVFKKKGDNWEGHGEDHEAALSFLTQNDAHCHLKDAMLRLHEYGRMEEYGCINTIHDSLMFCVPDGQMLSAQREIRAEMERPSQVLVDPQIAPGGLVVPVSISTGRRWNEMKEVK